MSKWGLLPMNILCLYLCKYLSKFYCTLQLVAQPQNHLTCPPLMHIEPNLPTKARKCHFRHFRDKICVNETFELGNGNTCIKKGEGFRGNYSECLLFWVVWITHSKPNLPTRSGPAHLWQRQKGRILTCPPHIHKTEPTTKAHSCDFQKKLGQNMI